MTTEERNEELIESERSTMRKGAEVLAELHARIAPRFGRAEAHGMRNEILASKQKNEKDVPLTCRRDERRRG